MLFGAALDSGEILPKTRGSFDKTSDLLRSDVKALPDGNFSFWLRSPKIAKEEGDTVEIWHTPGLEDVDPASFLSQFLKIRDVKFPDGSFPLFLRDNGQCLVQGIFLLF